MLAVASYLALALASALRSVPQNNAGNSVPFEDPPSAKLAAEIVVPYADLDAYHTLPRSESIPTV